MFDFVLCKAKKTSADILTVYNCAVPKEDAENHVANIDPANDQDNQMIFIDGFEQRLSGCTSLDLY